MLLVTYAEQLKMLAESERVDLFDAVRQAGFTSSTYYRSIDKEQIPLKQSTAEAIAAAIRELSIH